MRNFVNSAVAATMFVGLTASAGAQGYKPPLVGLKPPAVVVPTVPPVVAPPKFSYGPAFSRAEAAAMMAAARAEADKAREAAKAAAAAAKAAAKAGR